MSLCLREKINRREPIIGTRINSTWPMITEVVGATELYDYVELLCEYAPFDHYDLENVARASELHNMACIAKVDYECRGYVAQKAIASGFQGILFTDHTTADEVAETIRLIKPATPEHGGKLGFVNRRLHKNQGYSNQLDYADDVNDVIIGFMIEKQAAVENLVEICNVKGVDFIQFGPADYSMNCGVNMKECRELVNDIERKVIQTALSMGVSARVELNEANGVERYLDLGVTHFAVGSELRILKYFLVEQGHILKQMLDKK